METAGVDASGRSNFLALYDDAAPQVYRYLFRMCAGSAALAEDLTQETFLTAVGRFEDGRGGDVSVPWLMVVARNKVLEHHRRVGRGTAGSGSCSRGTMSGRAPPSETCRRRKRSHCCGGYRTISGLRLRSAMWRISRWPRWRRRWAGAYVPPNRCSLVHVGRCAAERRSRTMRDEEVKAVFAALDAGPRPSSSQRCGNGSSASGRTRTRSTRWPASGTAAVRYRRRRRDRDRRRVAESGIRARVGSALDVRGRHRGRRVAGRHVDGRRAPSGRRVAGGRAGDALPPPTTLPVVVDVGDRVRATIPVENTADSIAIADDAVWVAGWDGPLVSRIDVDTNEVVTVDVGSTGTACRRRGWRVGRCRWWPGAAARPGDRAGRGDDRRSAVSAPPR